MKIENAIPGCKSLVRSSGQCVPVSEMERLREMLTLIRDRTDGETCPVCSAVHELAKGELADRSGGEEC